MSDIVIPGVYSESLTSSFIAVMEKEDKILCLILRKQTAKTYYDVDERPKADFNVKYELVKDFPVEKAAKIYVQYGQYFGVTPGALELLSRLIPLSLKESSMSKKDKTKMEDQSATQSPVTEGVQVPVTETVDASGVKIKEPRAPRQSAARMFMDLIMEGILTDDEIFAAVKEKFGLDEKKRSYVAWYRNHLRKKLGQNPPPPVVRQPEQPVQ